MADEISNDVEQLTLLLGAMTEKMDGDFHPLSIIQALENIFVRQVVCTALALHESESEHDFIAKGSGVKLAEDCAKDFYGSLKKHMSANFKLNGHPDPYDRNTEVREAILREIDK